jgi:Kef-type K+ transport system membrane component KefB/nucleotide-binding universal stress UspA family protein
VLTPLGEHDLLLFWAQFTLLLIVARGLGYAFRRMGQPAVVGELAAGLLIGPSVFMRVLPAQANWLFPGSLAESAPILTVAWIGVALLLVETGFETDLALLRRLGRQAATVSLGSLLVPLVLGFAVGWIMPGDLFIGEEGSRFTFAAFIAVAMSISALPVVARILGEMDLMRRNLGQVTVAAAMVNDLIGWILLGVLAGIVTSGGVELGATLITVGATAAFFVLALTLGQRLTNTVLRVSRQMSGDLAGPLTATFLVVLVAATLTQAIGIEAVLGAFVAGIVIGRSPYQHAEVRRTIELLAAAVFAPIFFATAGIYVDLGAIASGTGLFWAVAIIVVATITKLVGSYVGARMGGLPHQHGVAIGIGLNARGAMEIVLATIAFSLGVFSQDAYTVIVLMAMVTSLIAPPLLRRVLRGVEPQGEEAQRLQREETLAASIVASTDRALLPTRGGMNSRLAAEATDLLLQPGASVSVLTVHAPGLPAEDCRCELAQTEMAEQLIGRRIERRLVVSADPAAAILDEAELNYGLVALGMTEEFRDTHELSAVLRALISYTRVPLLLVRHGADRSFEIGHTRRIMVPATGARNGRAAEEIGAVLAGRLDAHLDLVHVVARSDRSAEITRPQPVAAGYHGDGPDIAAQSLLDQAVRRAERFGARAQGSARIGAVTPEALLAAGREFDADLIVISTRARAVEGRPFLGHGPEFLLEHAPQTVLALIFPPEGGSGA